MSLRRSSLAAWLVTILLASPLSYATMTFPKHSHLTPSDTGDPQARFPANRNPTTTKSPVTTPKPASSTTQRGEFTGIAFPPQVFEILTGSEPTTQNLGGRKNTTSGLTSNNIETANNLTNIPELISGSTRPPTRIPPSTARPMLRPQAGSIAAAPRPPIGMMPDNRVGNETNRPKPERRANFRCAKMAVRGVHLYLQETLLKGTGSTKWDPATSNMLVSPLSLTLTYSQMLMAAGPRSKVPLRQILRVYPKTDPYEEVRHELNYHKQLGNVVHLMQRSDNTPVWMARDSDQPYVLESNTAIFVQTGLPVRPTFIHGIEDIYRGRISLADFNKDPRGSMESINSWASMVTRGKISNFLSAPPSLNTATLFASSLYFKAPWRDPFNSDLTGVEDFHVSYKEKIPVNYVLGELCNGTKFLDSSSLGIQAIKLAYNDTDDVAMYMFMSKNSSTSIKDLSNRLMKPSTKNNILQRIDGSDNPLKLFQDPLPPSWEAHKLASASANPVNNRADAQEVDPSWELDDIISMMAEKCAIVQVPKLILRGSLKLNPPGANGKDHLSGLVEDPNASFGSTSSNTIMHETYLEITETGTEAAAISAGSVDYMGGHNTFKANRPFLLLIRHEPTRMPLFWGGVVKPKTELPINTRFVQRGK